MAAADSYNQPMDREMTERYASLTLREPAATLWEHSHSRLQRAFEKAPDGPHEWCIGGGSILAARWGHRTSFDIDITVGPNTSLKTLWHGQDSELGALVLELDGEALNPNRYPTRRILLRFDRDPALGACSLDISALQAKPEGLQEKALVNGVPVTVLHTAQILRGKLERSERSPVRDVFDMATAGRRDTRALTIAINCLSEEQTEVIGTTWKASNRRFAEAAQEHLNGVDKEHQLETGTLGDQAAAAIDDARYKRLIVRAQHGTGSIDATTRSGHIYTFYVPAETFEQSLERTGIGTYLEKNMLAAYAARDTIRQRIEETGDTEEEIWDSNQGRPRSGYTVPPSRPAHTRAEPIWWMAGIQPDAAPRQTKKKPRR